MTDKYVKRKYAGEGVDPLTAYKKGTYTKGKINQSVPESLEQTKSDSPKKQMKF